MVKAWYMNDNQEEDQRLPHQLNPPQYVDLSYLKHLGVEHWLISPENYDENKEFQQIKKERGYTYQDVIACSPSTLLNYDEKIKSFYEEHIHTDEEIRYVLKGSGYFDVRDTDNRWIRIEVVKGDMIVLPAGIYHRFTLDSNNYIKALRLFVGEPVWTPYNRSSITEEHPSILQYRQTISLS